MKQINKLIHQIRKIDTLSVAEDVTGKDYKNDEETSILGFILQMEKNKVMKALLEEAGDTQLSNKLDNYIKIIEKFGFEQVYIEPFEYKGKSENMYIYFLEDLGIILHFDSFSWDKDGEKSINGGKFYYNWSPNNFRSDIRLTSSGGFYHPIRGENNCVGLVDKDLTTDYFILNYPHTPKYSKDLGWQEYRKIIEPIEKEQKELLDLALNCGKRVVWVGDHDCREALVTNIKALYENGKFLPIWKACQFPWLCHYAEMDSIKDYHTAFPKFVTATKTRLDKMPDKVKRCINNTYKG